MVRENDFRQRDGRGERADRRDGLLVQRQDGGGNGSISEIPARIKRFGKRRGRCTLPVVPPGEIGSLPAGVRFGRGIKIGRNHFKNNGNPLGTEGESKLHRADEATFPRSE